MKFFLKGFFVVLALPCSSIAQQATAVKKNTGVQPRTHTRVCRGTLDNADYYRGVQKAENLSDQQVTDMLVSQARYAATDGTDKTLLDNAYFAISAMHGFDTPEIRALLNEIVEKNANRTNRYQAVIVYVRLLRPEERPAEIERLVVAPKEWTVDGIVFETERLYFQTTELEQKTQLRKILRSLAAHVDDRSKAARLDLQLRDIDPSYLGSPEHLALIQRHAPNASGKDDARDIYLRQEARRLNLTLPKILPDD